MLVESKLRADIIELVEGGLSLDDFEYRFVAGSWNMHQADSISAIALASAVELRLAEHSSGHLLKNDLLAELSKLVSGIISVSMNQSLALSTGTSLKVSDYLWQQSGQLGGISLAVEYA